jgi:hypothetical protein
MEASNKIGDMSQAVLEDNIPDSEPKRLLCLFPEFEPIEEIRFYINKEVGVFGTCEMFMKLVYDIQYESLTSVLNKIKRTHNAIRNHRDNNSDVYPKLREQENTFIVLTQYASAKDVGKLKVHPKYRVIGTKADIKKFCDDLMKGEREFTSQTLKEFDKNDLISCSLFDIGKDVTTMPSVIIEDIKEILSISVNNPKRPKLESFIVAHAKWSADILLFLFSEHRAHITAKLLREVSYSGIKIHKMMLESRFGERRGCNLFHLACLAHDINLINILYTLGTNVNMLRIEFDKDKQLATLFTPLDVIMDGIKNNPEKKDINQALDCINKLETRFGMKYLTARSAYASSGDNMQDFEMKFIIDIWGRCSHLLK